MKEKMQTRTGYTAKDVKPRKPTEDRMIVAGAPEKKPKGGMRVMNSGRRSGRKRY